MSTLNVVWPEKGVGDYGFHRKDQTGGSGTEASVLRALNLVHSKAAQLKNQYIEKYTGSNTEET